MTRYRRAKILFNLFQITAQTSFLLFVLLTIERCRPIC